MKPSCASAATGMSSRIGRRSSPTRATAPRRWRRFPRCLRTRSARLRGSMRTAGAARSTTGLECPGTDMAATTVVASANLARATGNIGRPGVGVNPLRGQNNVQGSCDMGSFPHELSGYRHISGDATRAAFEALWGVSLEKEPGLRIPNMLDAALDGSFKGIYIQGE